MSPTVTEMASDLLTLAGLPDSGTERATFQGPQIGPMQSSFRVGEAANALVLAVSAAIAEVASLRAKIVAPPAMVIDSMESTAAFQSERHLRLTAETQLWDEFSGHYRTADGFIQFHTNFVHHRNALLAVIGGGSTTTRRDVEKVVERCKRFELEKSVADAGGIAAALRTTQEWSSHPHSTTVAGRDPVIVTRQDGGAPVPLSPTEPARPLAGLKVLDLTRVIAGPVCTRTLAAYGADVLRIGAPDLPVVDSILPDTTLGKRFAHCDITTPDGRDIALRLVAEADVMVVGFRPGALDGYGLGSDRLFEANPNLVLARLSAFGADGPWGGKRGFDSITQTATGIVASEMQAFQSESPRSLPCQLLDHGSGFLLSLGILAALSQRHKAGGGHTVDVSLLTTRNWLESLGPADPAYGHQVGAEDVAPYLETRSSPFGPMTHARHPGWIDGIAARWDLGPSIPGTDRPSWQHGT